MDTVYRKHPTCNLPSTYSLKREFRHRRCTKHMTSILYFQCRRRSRSCRVLCFPRGISPWKKIDSKAKASGADRRKYLLVHARTPKEAATWFEIPAFWRRHILMEVCQNCHVDADCNHADPTHTENNRVKQHHLLGEGQGLCPRQNTATLHIHHQLKCLKHEAPICQTVPVQEGQNLIPVWITALNKRLWLHTCILCEGGKRLILHLQVQSVAADSKNKNIGAWYSKSHIFRRYNYHYKAHERDRFSQRLTACGQSALEQV